MNMFSDDEKPTEEKVEEKLEKVAEETADNDGMPLSPAADEAESGVARLIIKRNGVESEDVFPFTPPATVGRFDASVGPIDIDLGTIPEGSYVSRKHAKIVREEGVWKVVDLGSSNGTFKLGADDFERVEEAELADGDEIAFGNARLVFRLGRRSFTATL